jgi:hypothetical protein
MLIEFRGKSRIGVGLTKAGSKHKTPLEFSVQGSSPATELTCTLSGRQPSVYKEKLHGQEAVLFVREGDTCKLVVNDKEVLSQRLANQDVFQGVQLVFLMEPDTKLRLYTFSVGTLK